MANPVKQTKALLLARCCFFTTRLVSSFTGAIEPLIPPIPWKRLSDKLTFRALEKAAAELARRAWPSAGEPFDRWVVGMMLTHATLGKLGKEMGADTPVFLASA